MIDNNLNYLQIFRTHKIGLKTFYKLFNQFDGDHLRIKDFLMAQGFKLPGIDQIKKEVDLLYKKKGHILFYHDKMYPQILKTIDDPPPFIMVLGNLNVLHDENIAIIGARNASLAGTRFIHNIALSLSNKNYKIVSGMARGIDTASHKASLSNGTIAVLAGGVDQIYPFENTKLYHQIQESGAIISEMPFGTAPSANLFARRNRVISGLSKAVIICEASFKSGSMITADYALQQGREIFVVPGHPSDPRSFGGNRLIQQGANLLHDVKDVLDIMEEFDVAKYRSSSQKKEIKIEKQECEINPSSLIESVIDMEKKVLSMLSVTPTSIDEILEAIPELSPSKLMTMLTKLEFEDAITIHSNQTVSI